MPWHHASPTGPGTPAWALGSSFSYSGRTLVRSANSSSMSPQSQIWHTQDCRPAWLLSGSLFWAPHSERLPRGWVLGFPLGLSCRCRSRLPKRPVSRLTYHKNNIRHSERSPRSKDLRPFPRLRRRILFDSIHTKIAPHPPPPDAQSHPNPTQPLAPFLHSQ